MKKECIAFVVGRYGAGINGGAEEHCRMLAERIGDKYDVVVLTTCIAETSRGARTFLEGEDIYRGVRILRFRTEPQRRGILGSLGKNLIVKPMIKLRQFMDRHRWDASRWEWLWRLGESADELWHRSHSLYSPSMIRYIREHRDEYRAFIPLTYCFPPCIYTVLTAPERTLMIPTLHDERDAYRPLIRHIFRLATGIAFNTPAEERLARRLYGEDLRGGIVSVSFEDRPRADWSETKAKYSLPDRYILFLGRIVGGKGINEIVQYFLRYRAQYPDEEIQLVMVGGANERNKTIHPNIIYTGYVSDEEKYAIIQHATVFVNPSRYESLSLIMLEGMHYQRAMLVNGRCEVLREHCQRSGGAAWYYTSEREFVDMLHQLIANDDLRTELGKRGVEYVREHYSWEGVIERLFFAIDSLPRIESK